LPHAHGYRDSTPTSSTWGWPSTSSSSTCSGPATADVPARFCGFSGRYNDLLLYDGARNVKLEKLVFGRFLGAVRDAPTGDRAVRRMAMDSLCRLAEREPVPSRSPWTLGTHPHYRPKLGLLSHHDPREKRAILRKRGVKGGANIQKLLTSSDVSYYNSKGERAN
jgi:hypothetical protein